LFTLATLTNISIFPLFQNQLIFWFCSCPPDIARADGHIGMTRAGAWLGPSFLIAGDFHRLKTLLVIRLSDRRWIRGNGQDRTWSAAETCSVTLPKNNRDSPLFPRVAMMTKSTPSVFACSTIFLLGLPSSTFSSTLAAGSRSQKFCSTNCARLTS